jgi:hypothetical protein
MKPAKLLSIIMLVSVSGFTTVAFSSRLVDYYCYKYNGPRPASGNDICTASNYTKFYNTGLICYLPRQVFCGFCIRVDSPCFDPSTGDPNWNCVCALLTGGSPTKVYDDPTLDGIELSDAGGPKAVYPYYERQQP